MKVGIAVTTTPNREGVFKLWYTHYAKFCPEIPLYIHNDINYNGVAYSKNKCIEALYDAGYTHIFLFDDDLLIQSSDFINAYSNSGLNHACWNYDRQFVKFGVEAGYGKCNCYAEYSTPNGCMLYVKRNVIDIVGGFDNSFVGYGYDHPNWSDRIHNNGLTPARYIDIYPSTKLFEMANCESSFSYEQRSHIPENQALYKEKYYSKEFIPYK